MGCPGIISCSRAEKDKRRHIGVISRITRAAVSTDDTAGIVVNRQL